MADKKQKQQTIICISCMKRYICFEQRKTLLLTDELVPLLLDLDVAVEAGVHHVQAEVFAGAQLCAAEAAGGARVHPLQGRAALRRGGRLKEGGKGDARCTYTAREDALWCQDKGIKEACRMQPQSQVVPSSLPPHCNCDCVFRCDLGGVKCPVHHPRAAPEPEETSETSGHCVHFPTCAPLEERRASKWCGGDNADYTMAPKIAVSFLLFNCAEAGRSSCLVKVRHRPSKFYKITYLWSFLRGLEDGTPIKPPQNPTPSMTAAGLFYAVLVLFFLQRMVRSC